MPVSRVARTGVHDLLFDTARYFNALADAGALLAPVRLSQDDITRRCGLSSDDQVRARSVLRRAGVLRIAADRDGYTLALEGKQ